MKKLWIAAGAAALAALLCACSTNVKNPLPSAGNATPEVSACVSDYFPVHSNSRLVYQGEGNDSASYEVCTDYARDGRQQQRIITDGTISVRVIDTSENEAAVVFAQGDTAYRQNVLDQTSGTPETLLRTPLIAGTAWLPDGPRTRTITGTGMRLDTPLGAYDAIEVTTEGPYGKTMDYYAKGIGLIKTSCVSDSGSVTSVLAKIEEGVPLVQTVRFYFPDVETGQLRYGDRDVRFYTNDSTRDVLAKAYREPAPDYLGQVFSSGTQINSLYLNKDGMVYIDLNKAFQKEMNAGAAVESMILQCVANTFGHYYGASHVLLTVDGQSYDSGHISLAPGESLTVDDADVNAAAAWAEGE